MSRSRGACRSVGRRCRRRECRWPRSVPRCCQHLPFPGRRLSVHSGARAIGEVADRSLADSAVAGQESADGAVGGDRCVSTAGNAVHHDHGRIERWRGGRRCRRSDDSADYGHDGQPDADQCIADLHVNASPDACSGAAGTRSQERSTDHRRFGQCGATVGARCEAGSVAARVERPEVPDAWVRRVGTIIRRFPETTQERAWVGVCWRVRRATIAHVFGGEDQRIRITFRADPAEVLDFEHLGTPYFRAELGQQCGRICCSTTPPTGPSSRSC